MDNLKERMVKIMQEEKSGILDRQAWSNAVADLNVNYVPIELAILFKDIYGFNAREITFALKGIEVEHKAVTVGGIILDKAVYPDTTSEEMTSILQDAFPEEDIEQAISILYPTMLRVDASTIWKDTGITVSKDEIAIVEYVQGIWNINPYGRSSDANGISVTAKQGYALPGYNEGCLVGKVGDDAAFYIGMKGMIQNKSGTLYLIANDDINGMYGAGYGDNSGYIEVKITKKLI